MASCVTLGGKLQQKLTPRLSWKQAPTLWQGVSLARLRCTLRLSTAPLLALGADMMAWSEFGSTPLHNATQYGTPTNI